MASHNSLRRAVSGLVLLAAFAAVTDAEAQRRRMPVRTEPIPDTETGGKAGSAGSIEAQDPKAQDQTGALTGRHGDMGTPPGPA